jgi:hypothetical protein
MSETNDGGPAFLCGYHPEGNTADHAGMTLRDWFAGMALMGMIEDWNLHGNKPAMAKEAFGLANAMLEARKTK